MSFSKSQSLSGGIPLPTDSPLRAGIRKRFQKKTRGRADEPTVELGDAESNVLTEPRLSAPTREPTMTLNPDELEIVDTPIAPMRANQPAPKVLTGARREDSVLFKLPSDGEGDSIGAGLAALGARDEEETRRESSVALSLGELRNIEDQRVAGEMAGNCSAQLKKLDERLTELKAAYERTERAYSSANIDLDISFTEAVEALEPKRKLIAARLDAAKATIKLRPNEEGYRTLEEHRTEFDTIWSEMSGTIWSVEAAETQNREARQNLAGLKKTAAEEAERKRKDESSERRLEEEVDDLLSVLPAPTREPSLTIEVDDSAIEKAVPDEKPKGKIRRAFGGLLTLLGIGKVESEPPAETDNDDREDTTEFRLPIMPEAPKTDGVPWADEHVQYSLSDNELTICESVMDERKVYWMIPVPASDEPNADNIMKKFKDDAVVRLGGKKYFIFEGEEGFADARMISRVGKGLHIWSVEMTDYEYLESISIEIKDRRKEEVEWPDGMNSYVMNLKECAECNYFLPENKPRWLHPVPASNTRNETDMAILQTMAGTQQITLKGQKFYLLNVATVADWRELVLHLPKTRIVTRGNNWLSVWDQNENGKYMFFNSGSFSSSYYGPKGKRLKEQGETKPHDSERMEVELVFDKIKKVWLYELDDLANMDSNPLSWIVKSANSTVSKHGISPLISVDGRWYVALDIYVPDSMMAEYDGSKVRLLNEKIDTSEWIRRRKAERDAKSSGAAQKLSLPPEPEQKKASILALPEGEVKHLLHVDPDFTGEIYRPWVSMTVEGKKNKLLILDEPHQDSIAVVRKGNQVFFASIEGHDEDEESLEIALD